LPQKHPRLTQKRADLLAESDELRGAKTMTQRVRVADRRSFRSASPHVPGVDRHSGDLPLAVTLPITA
jgi:hypothetical protein